MNGQIFFDDGGAYLIRKVTGAKHKLDLLDLAYEIGVLDAAMYQAGQIFRELWDTAQGSSEPRYEPICGDGISGNHSDSAALALSRITRIRHAFGRNGYSYGLCLAVVHDMWPGVSVYVWPGSFGQLVKAMETADRRAA